MLPVRIVLGSEVVQQKYALNPLAFHFYVDTMYERQREKHIIFLKTDK